MCVPDVLSPRTFPLRVNFTFYSLHTLKDIRTQFTPAPARKSSNSLFRPFILARGYERSKTQNGRGWGKTFLRPLCVHSRAPRTLCLRARRKITCVDRIGSEQKKSGIGFLLSMPTNKICTITIRFVARALISFWYLKTALSHGHNSWETQRKITRFQVMLNKVREQLRKKNRRSDVLRRYYKIIILE